LRAKAKRKAKRTHLPPAIAVDVIPLDDFDAFARTKGDLVFVLRDKVVSSIDVFHHGKCCERGVPCEVMVSSGVVGRKEEGEWCGGESVR
jgi:hypothetical protein